MYRYNQSPSPQLKARKRYQLVSLALWLAAATVLVTGLILSWRGWMANRQASHQATVLIAQANLGLNHSVPSTTKVTASAFSSYRVAPTLPRYLYIPKIGVAAIVRSLGLTADGQMGVPDNIYDVGWYNASSKPGVAGVTVIDGHVSSWTSNGVFYAIKTLQPGDSLQVERGDGSKVDYRVIKKQIYDYQAVDMAAVLKPVNPAKSGLNLITCTGDVIKGTNDFSQRIVVFAEEL